LILLIPFVAAKLGKPLDRLMPIDLSPDIVRLFLAHLEESRQCSIATRNQRLATVHALARFVGERSPEHIVWCGQMRAIPFKKTTKAVIPYLDKPEMDALLAAPDRQTSQGRRDYALLLFLYNSGARADEAAQLVIRDLHSADLFVRIIGKGNKERQCPLWRATVDVLSPLIANRSSAQRVFLNRSAHPITRFGISERVNDFETPVGVN
jgi:integrase/recombinase XerD